MTWTVPRMWAGKTVAILASGPSMSKAVADAVMHLPTIVINSTFRLAPWASLLYATDATWWRNNTDAMRFRGVKVSMHDIHYADLPGVNYVKKGAAVGFDLDRSTLCHGGNSGYAAVHLAAHAGAARILLLGMDMHGGHWHGEHPDPLVNTAPETFAGKFIPRFATLALSLRDMGVEVINCTPGSALRCFHMMPLQAALADCALATA